MFDCYDDDRPLFSNTIDANLSGDPFSAGRPGSLIKPGELVDLKEITPLNLAEMRIFNLLLANAWDEIARPKTHRIHKALLRGAHDSNDRLKESLKKLMGAIAIVDVVKDDKRGEMRVHLLSTNILHEREDGFFYYTFPAELIEIIKTSTVFARLRSQVMHAIRSKYALRLYEVIEKRINLERKRWEEFSLERLRNLLGVDPSKLKRFADFNKYALQPALQEVNALSGYHVDAEHIYKGRRVGAITLYWFRSTQEGRLEAAEEVQRRTRRAH